MVKHNVIILGVINLHNKSLQRWYNNNLSTRCCDKNKLNLIKKFSECYSKTQNNLMQKQNLTKTT